MDLRSCAGIVDSIVASLMMLLVRGSLPRSLSAPLLFSSSGRALVRIWARLGGSGVSNSSPSSLLFGWYRAGDVGATTQGLLLVNLLSTVAGRHMLVGRFSACLSM